MAKKSKLFDFRLLPMDSARIVCAPLLAVYRMRRLNGDGTKYTGRLKGGAVIAANHTSMEDPFLVGTAFWYRRLHFLVAEAVMSSRLKDTMLKGAGAIRIDRNGADIEAINQSVEVLQKGRLLAVFPQGSIQKQEGISAIKSGITLIALRAQVPIIPIMILPKKKWYNRRTVVIGDAVIPKDYVQGPFPTMVDIEKITETLAQRMKQLSEVRV